MDLEVVGNEDVVIVGAGIAGLTTALALHRLGIKSLVLESSSSLRASGFAYTTWSNAWKAFDSIGIAHALRKQHPLIHGFVSSNTNIGQKSAELSFKDKGKEEVEVRCVKRQVLVETLANELPPTNIRFSSKLGDIKGSANFKLLYLDDGTIIKTKVLIGCDRFYGDGYRSGLLPCDDTTIYWFFTWTSSDYDIDNKVEEDNLIQKKAFVLSTLENEVHHKMKVVVENTQVENMVESHLRYRHPWELLWGNISKGNTCVAGDALHPMTPDIGQGGCSALEDGVVLARCLSEALNQKSSDNDEYKKIEIGLKKYAQQRRWRSFDLITTSYLVGFIQQSNGKLLTLFRDTILANFIAGLLLKKSRFDCGKLITIS
ncbi:FAD/NAD(P)-binding oxidoreductase family protein [Euphorbia peplus]|nr:FAD/NAD(P)-binding oxidoreductase family protein [Euphorbia peplus]